MIFSDFGQKLNAHSGILQLMDDLGKPLPQGVPSFQLGGGNPARIEQVEKVYRREMESLLQRGDDFENALARYDAPVGRISFIESLAELLSSTYGWKISAKNIAISNGSQSAFFYLFNLFSGKVSNDKNCKKKTILFPLVPEYVGYADQGVEPDTFVSIPAKFETYDDNTFKYFIDFEALEEYLSKHEEVGAMCVSRPTNPTGNVLTDDEISHLSALAKKYNIPLMVDNAYGLPFPNIIFTDNAKPFWSEEVVLSMSLSKIGLPSLRTGIIVASEEIITALSNINAIASLASGSLGQVIAEPLVKSGELISMGKDFVRPFYNQKSMQAQSWIHEFFAGTKYGVHKSEGAIFHWLMLNDLSISTLELYSKLKERGVITVPGEYFFFGLDKKSGEHPHMHKCLRINYSRPQDEVKEGLRIIAEVYKQNSV